MRRFALISVLCALAFPGAAAAFPGPPGSFGSLAINQGNGDVTVTGTGVIYGYFQQGLLRVFSYQPNDPTGTLVVEGAGPWKLPGLTMYVGADVRFMLPAGRYIIEFVGSGLDLSAVGAGTVNATGAGTLSDGSIAFDGGKPVSLDRVVAIESFGSAPAAGTSTTTGTTP
jgi:hypothetical protein